MTLAEIRAYNGGVHAVLDIASRAAASLRAESGWKPTREGAADALDELAESGKALLLDDPDAPLGALAAPSPSPTPRTELSPHEAIVIVPP